MNSAYHIDNFDQLVLHSFKSSIEKFNLKLVDKTDEFGSELLLVGDKCQLRFTYDRGDLRCTIINPINNRRYLSNLIYKFLSGHNNEIVVSINDPIPVQIEKYARMFTLRLSHILQGDFSWGESYDFTYP